MRAVTTVTFCNPHQRIPEPSAPFLSPQAQSRNLTVISDSEHPFPITLDHFQCHGSTGSPSALLRRVLRGGVTVLEGQGF